MMLKRVLLVLSIFCTTFMISAAPVSAATYQGFYGSTISDNHFWCNVLGVMQAGYSPNNCVTTDAAGNQTVRQDDALTFLETACPNTGTICMKTNFINYITSALNSGDSTNMQHDGATYVINTMLGIPGASATKDIYPNGANSALYNNWVARVNQPSVGLKILTNYVITNNTAIDPVTNDVVSYTEYANPEVADTLAFMVNGTLTYTIKMDCGNPVGLLGALPDPSGGGSPSPSPSPSGGGATSPTTKPLVSVTGGDVVAGATFAAADGSGVVPCYATGQGTDPDTNAGIATWNQDTAPAYTGSGDNLAAYALSAIQEFATRQNTGPPVDLSFSNTNNNNPAGGMFGGMFGTGSISACADYWSRYHTEKDAGKLTNFTAGNLNGLANQDYVATAPGNPLQIGNSVIQANPVATHSTLFVEGNVLITGDITYQNGNGGGTWNGAGGIPSFTLVVHGSIFISPNVKELDGTYVAVPDKFYPTTSQDFTTPRAGTISTCADGNGSYNPIDLNNNNYLTDCSKSQLTVYGSFVANQVWLLRSSGNLDAGGPPAEVFKYGPEVWLPPSGTNITGTYQSASSLPPIL
jgi:hypothetical protein